MKWRYRILIFLFFLPVQALFLEYFRFWGIKADLALVVIYLMGLFYGRTAGLLWGLTFGALLDLFSVGILGVDFGLKAIMGLLAGVLGKSLLNLTFVANMGIVFAFSVLHDIAGVLFFRGIEPDGMGGLFLFFRDEVLPRGIYNSLLAAAFFVIFFKNIRVKGSIENAGPLFSPGGKSRFTE